MKNSIIILAISFLLNSCGGNQKSEPLPTFSSPIISSINSFLSNGSPRVKITWSFPVFEEPIIKGFKLEKSENNGEFKEVLGEIAVNQRLIELAETFRGGRVSFRISTISDKNPTTSIPVSYFAESLSTASFCTSLSTTILQVNADKPTIYLSWNPNIPGFFFTGSYQVFRGNSETATPVLIASTKDKFFVDKEVENDKTYNYVIRTGTVNCNSNVVPITAKKNPNGLCPTDFKVNMVTENNKKSAILTWDAQLSNFSSFSVKRATSLNGNYTILKENLQSTAFQDKSDLEKNTSYFYKIAGFINSQPPTSCETLALEVK